MPLYEYECGSCGTRFERIQKFSDPLTTACPSCGGTAKRLISSPAIQFKGTGFYITDYGKAGQSSAEGSSEKPEKAAKADTASAAKTDKPAANSGGSETVGKSDAAQKSEAAPAVESKTSSTPAKPAGSSGE